MTVPISPRSTAVLSSSVFLLSVAAGWLLLEFIEFLAAPRPATAVVVDDGLRTVPPECWEAPDFYGCLTFAGAQ